MWKITRIIVKRFWGLLAFVLFCLALFVVLGRELAPMVGDYRENIAAYVSEKLNATVTFQNLETDWQGLRPQLKIEGLKISQEGSEESIVVAEVIAKFDFLQSLITLSPYLTELKVSAVNLPLLQDGNGHWQILQFETGDNTTTLTLDDIVELSDRIEFVDVTLDVTVRSGHNTIISFPNLLVESKGSFHRLSTQAAVDQQNDVLNFVMETEGDFNDLEQFTAKGYLRLQNFELDRALAATLGDLWEGLPDQEWRKGHDLNVEVWFDVFSGNQILARGNFNVGEVPVAMNSKFTPPANTASRFVFQWRNFEAWSLSLHNLYFQWPDIESPKVDALLKSAKLGDPIVIAVPEIQVSEWTSTLLRANFLAESLHEKIQTLNPRGMLKHLVVNVDPADLAKFHMRANVEAVSIDAMDGIPGLQNISGYLDTSYENGFMDLNSEDGLVANFEKIYDEPFVFDRASGHLSWRFDTSSELLYLYSGLLSVQGDTGNAQGYFSLNTPLQAGTGIDSELVLQLNAQNARALDHDKFIPRGVPQSLRDWLTRSVKAGSVPRGAFIYRGGINKENLYKSATQLYLQVDNAELQFHTDWPALSSGSGEIWVDNRDMNGMIAGGRLFQSQLNNTTLAVGQDQQGMTYVNLQGELYGGAQDGLRFLTETPIRERFGGQLDDWQLSGNITTDFTVRVPIANKDTDATVVDGEAGFNGVDADTYDFSMDNGQSEQDISVRLENVNLSIPKYNIDVTDMGGVAEFEDQSGLHFKNINARFLEKPITLNMEPQSSDNGPMHITVAGSAMLDDIRAWIKRPELDFFEGEAVYKAELTLPNQNQQALQIVVNSELTGVVVALPMPYGKTADEVKPLVFKSMYAGDSAQHEFLYDGVSGNLLTENGQLIRGAVAINQGLEVGTDAQLMVAGSMQQLHWQEWQQVFENYQTFLQQNSQNQQQEISLPIAFDLSIKDFYYGEQHLADVKVVGKQGNDLWQLSVVSPLLAGDITWFEQQKAPTVVDLEYLRLPKLSEATDEPEVAENVLEDKVAEGESSIEKYSTEKNQDYLQQFDPTTIPALDFATQSFSIGEEEYGTWSFQLRPIEHGVQVSNIIAHVKGGSIQEIPEQNQQQNAQAQSAAVANNGATLVWTKQGEEVQTRFNGRYATDDPVRVFNEWKQPQAFDSEDATFDFNLSWPGSPTAIDVLNLKGQIAVNLRKGEFFQSENTSANDFLRLFALFNFDTWAKRLRFDFSDLYGKGMDFDSVTGEIDFNNGNALIAKPIVVESPASRMRLAGRINLDNFEMDGTLEARLPVGENLTWVAFFAGGLPAAFGTYLVSKIFKRQVDKVASLSYRVQGTINDPNIKFEKMFDNKTVEKQGKESQEMLDNPASQMESVEP